jgi:enterochelin esterase-like enzyme
MLLLAAWLAGCANAVGAGVTVEAAATQTATDEATSIPKAAVTPTALGKASPTPTPEGADCRAETGTIERFELESEHLELGLQVRVYTPPCYAQQTGQRYPVLYFIHGQTFNDDQWDRIGADEAADALMSSGEIPPFLIVMPYDISSAQPSIDPFRPAVVEELVPWVDENYRTLAAREFRAVGGLSRGGSWALHFGMQYPEIFGAVGGHSPPVFVEDASLVRGWLDAIPAELMPRIWLDIGNRDRPEIYNSAEWFASVLDEKGIPHEWHLNPGQHNEAYWSAHVSDYLRWYAEPW